MTSFRSHCCLALLALVLASSTAWMPVSPVSRPNTGVCRPTSPTRLGMFDWGNMFNQGAKKKPEEEKKEEKKEEAPVEEEVKAEAVVEEVKPADPAPAPAPAPAVEAVKPAEPEPAPVVEAVKPAEVKSAPPAPPVGAPSDNSIHKGTVTWFNPSKGFGFIRPAGSPSKEGDVFVHQSQIQVDGYRRLMDGEEVEYKLEHDDTGRARAINVTGPNGGDVVVATRRKENAEN